MPCLALQPPHYAPWEGAQCQCQGSLEMLWVSLVGIHPTFHHTVPQLGMQKLFHNLTEMTHNMFEA